LFVLVRVRNDEFSLCISSTLALHSMQTLRYVAASPIAHHPKVASDGASLSASPALLRWRALAQTLFFKKRKRIWCGNWQHSTVRLCQHSQSVVTVLASVDRTAIRTLSASDGGSMSAGESNEKTSLESKVKLEQRVASRDSCIPRLQAH
jgi:hypothetical protein